MTVPCSCLRQVSRVRPVAMGFKRRKGRRRTLWERSLSDRRTAAKAHSRTPKASRASSAPTGLCHRFLQWCPGQMGLPGTPLSTAMTTAEVVDQALGRSIFGRGLFAAGQAVVDALAQFLAQLHTPLIEGVDAPDHAL